VSAPSGRHATAEGVVATCLKTTRCGTSAALGATSVTSAGCLGSCFVYVCWPTRAGTLVVVDALSSKQMCANRWIDGPRRRDQSPSWVHRHLQRGGQRRYRTSHPGSGRRWEFPSGSADAPGDVDATVAAARELREEPGLTAGTLLLLDTLDVAPGMSSQQCRVFVATDLTHGVAQRELEEQDMRSAWFSRREIEGLICDGTISDVKSIAGYTRSCCCTATAPRIRLCEVRSNVHGWLVRERSHQDAR